MRVLQSAPDLGHRSVWCVGDGAGLVRRREAAARATVIYQFDAFELDVERRELRDGGVAVAVEPQVFDVLSYLVAHHDRFVSKEELLDNIWRHRFVSESALTSRIKSARRAVGDTGR